MIKDEVISALRDAEPKLRAQGVTRAALFGSIARGEAGPKSDIDIMIDIDPDADVGVYGLVEIMHAIEDLLSMKVDVSDRQTLRPFVRPSAEREAIHAF